jgi:hypothetical protein
MDFLRYALVLLLCPAGGSLRVWALEAGAAKTVVTPASRGRPVYLAGFGSNRPATGIQDNFWARYWARSQH